MSHPPPDALLLMAPGCAHCPVVLEGLSRLLETGRLGRLEVVNIAANTDTATALGVRSVPWCRIGPFELTGLHTPAELAQWAEHAARGTGMPDYLADLLASQRLPQVIRQVTQEPARLADLVALLGDLQTPMGVRIGVGAVFEELAEAGRLAPAAPLLAPLAHAADPQVRADVAHYLGMTGAPDAAAVLRELLGDSDAEVREIAAEALAELAQSGAEHTG